MTENPKRDIANDDPWEDLVVALLSVNQYSLEKTYENVDGLRTQGLFSPKNLASWDKEEILRRLKAGGCDRGEFMTNLFAIRLANLGQFVSENDPDACFAVLSRRSIKAIEGLLLQVNGIGPKVIYNFCFLRDIPAEK